MSLAEWQKRIFFRRFDFYDTNKNGILNKEDYETRAKTTAKFLGINEGSDEYKKMFDLWLNRWNILSKSVSNLYGDKDFITQEEFLGYCEKLQTDDTLFDKDITQFAKSFLSFDVDHDGKLSYQEFTNVRRALKPDTTDVELKNTFDLVDKDKNGFISFDEMVEWVKDAWRLKNEDDFNRKIEGNI